MLIKIALIGGLAVGGTIFVIFHDHNTPTPQPPPQPVVQQRAPTPQERTLLNSLGSVTPHPLGKMR
jgi:hypothetical protein